MLKSSKMKLSDKIKKEKEEYHNRLKSILRHIKNVQNNCILLGEKLIDDRKYEMGKMLIANGFIHDNSKFFGIEWDYISDASLAKKNKARVALSVEQHNKTNKHHPEYWGGIKNMPDVYVGEMVCDWKSRSEEFGSSLIDWINDAAMKRFQFKKGDAIYGKIMYFVDMLCQKPFQPLPDVKVDPPTSSNIS